MTHIPLLPFLAMMLAGAHALGDYGLQSAYVADRKVRSPDNPNWAVVLAAHSLTHGMLVMGAAFAFQLVAGKYATEAASLAAFLGWAEFCAHSLIDDMKGQKRFSYATDQALHYGCKAVWAAILLAAVG